MVGRIFRALPQKQWRRSLASEADAINASLQNQLKETHSIESALQAHLERPVPQIDDQSHTSKDPLKQEVAGLSPKEMYSTRMRHRM